MLTIESVAAIIGKNMDEDSGVLEVFQKIVGDCTERQGKRQFMDYLESDMENIEEWFVKLPKEYVTMGSITKCKNVMLFTLVVVYNVVEEIMKKNVQMGRIEMGRDEDIDAVFDAISTVALCKQRITDIETFWEERGMELFIVC